MSGLYITPFVERVNYRAVRCAKRADTKQGGFLMRKTIFLTGTALLFAASLLFFTGCQNVFQPEDEARTGFVSLSFDRGWGRTIMPDHDMDDFDSFYLRFDPVGTPAGRDPIALPGLDDLPLTVELHVGEWALTVFAYMGGGANTRAATATYTFTVSGALTTPIVVELVPMTAAGVMGLFTWEIHIEDDLDVVSGLIVVTGIPGGGTMASEPLTIPGMGTGRAAIEGNVALLAGRYRVTITLNHQLGETAIIHEVLHVYNNMTSNLVIDSDPGNIINLSHFPVSLTNRILRSWDGAVWDLAGLDYRHFTALGIEGLDATNWGVVFGRFTDLSYDANSETPYTLARLGVLVDAALIERAGSLPGITGQTRRDHAMTYVRGLLENSSTIPANGFAWVNNTQVNATVAGAGVYYIVPVNFDDDVLRVLTGDVVLTRPAVSGNPGPSLLADFGDLDWLYGDGSGDLVPEWTIQWFRIQTPQNGTPIDTGVLFAGTPFSTATVTHSTGTTNTHALVDEDRGSTVFVRVSSTEIHGNTFRYIVVPTTGTFNFTLRDWDNPGATADINAGNFSYINDLHSSGGDITITLVNYTDFEVTRWHYRGLLRGTGGTVNLTTAMHQGLIGRHFVTVEVEYEHVSGRIGIYSRRVFFDITP